MAMRSATIKELFSRAAGRCSICNIFLFGDNYSIGEVAHIISKRKDGPRGNFSFDGDHDGYENLILLCANDHAKIDGPEGQHIYPPDRLHELKRNHEERCSALLSKTERKNGDMAALDYIVGFSKFNSQRSFLNQLPERLHCDIFLFGLVFENLPLDLAVAVPFSNARLQEGYDTLEQAYDNFIAESIPYYFLPDDGRGPWLYVVDKPSAKRSDVHRSLKESIRELRVAYEDLLYLIRSEYPEVDLLTSSYR